MISTSDLSISYGGKKLFEDASVKFTKGHCYGLIGANGAGKSTFLKILSGEIDANSGEVVKNSKSRLSVLRQDHFAYDEFSVLETVLMGNEKLFKIMKDREAIYSKPDFSDADGIAAAQLEDDFAQMNGYEAESEAEILLAGLGLLATFNEKKMSELEMEQKIKVLLARALFGNPDILLLDEPTNHLDIDAIRWLEDFLYKFENTAIVVSHDRHFLNQVCTHIADIDYGKVRTYTGNYDFWLESIQIQQKLVSDQNKKKEDRAKELKSFIQRFSANASKSKQATSRKKQLRPFVDFQPNRSLGNDVLVVENLSASIDGEVLLKDISFRVSNKDKIALLGNNSLAKTTLLNLLSGDLSPDSGEIKWGVTVTRSYFPDENIKYFEGTEARNLVDWLRQYSNDQDENFVRGFLGKMLFTKDEALKSPSVLSGGERVRCMLSKMMLSGANFLMLDGPTNHLDLDSISAVNDGMIRFPESLIFTSHDHQMLDTVANRLFFIDDSGQLHEFPGSYTDYVSKENK